MVAFGFKYSFQYDVELIDLNSKDQKYHLNIKYLYLNVTTSHHQERNKNIYVTETSNNI